MVMVAPSPATEMGTEYNVRVPDVTGSVPSMVYQIDAPAVAQFIVTLWSASYVPATGEKVGGSTGP